MFIQRRGEHQSAPGEQSGETGGDRPAGQRPVGAVAAVCGVPVARVANEGLNKPVRFLIIERGSD